jgi:hypothetical protein
MATAQYDELELQILAYISEGCPHAHDLPPRPQTPSCPTASNP